MKKRTPKILVLIAVGIAGAVLAGCQESRIAATPREGSITAQEGPLDFTYGQPDYIDISEAPPVHLVDALTAQPGPGYVWIDGYWNWGAQGYEWVYGHWQIPPSVNHTWTPPNYEKHGDGVRYNLGRWEERPVED
jgi:hypothetical protein